MYTLSLGGLLIVLTVDLASSCLTPSPPSPPAPAPSPPSSGTCRCGRRNVRNKIVGGNSAGVNEYPWQVALVIRGGRTPFCGGTLLSSKTVLTAAHCWKPASQIQVLLGEHNINNNADGQQRFGVTEFKRDPAYNSGTQDNDFAIITLNGDATFTDKISPACLPNSGTNYDNRVATVTGWGTLSSGGPQPSTLQEVDVNTMSNSQCVSSSIYGPSDITSNMICAAASGKDSCQGDSGGPLVTWETAGYYSLIGVVSWGSGCAQANAPGVYARVTNKLTWIGQNIKGNRCPK